MSNKESFDASSKADVAAIKEKSKSADETHSDDIKWMMNDPRGRRIAWDLMSKCHVFESSFSPNLSQTNFNEGERNVGLRLFNDIMENASDQYMRMAEENSK